MKRYDCEISHGELGDTYAEMIDSETGQYVYHYEHEKAVAAAVLAEQKRVWDVVQAQIKTAYLESGKEIPYGDSYHSDKAVILDDLLLQLFPDGEPKEVNPPAGERREM